MGVTKAQIEERLAAIDPGIAALLAEYHLKVAPLTERLNVGGLLYLSYLEAIKPYWDKLAVEAILTKRRWG